MGQDEGPAGHGRGGDGGRHRLFLEETGLEEEDGGGGGGGELPAEQKTTPF